jgi:hypothetical protein
MKKSNTGTARLALVVVLCACAPLAASRADEAAPPGSAAPADVASSTAARRWTMGFGYRTGVGVEGMDGPDLTLQREAHDGRHAWRLGVGVEQTNLSGNETEIDYGFPVTATRTAGGPNKTSRTRLELSILHMSGHGDPGDARFFWGIGPLVGWSSDHLRQDITVAQYDTTSLVYSYTGNVAQTFTTLRVGLGGSIGARWPLSRRVDLAAEFNQSLVYRRDRSEQSEDFPGSAGYGNRLKSHAEGVEFQAHTLRAGVLVRL